MANTTNKFIRILLCTGKLYIFTYMTHYNVYWSEKQTKHIRKLPPFIYHTISSQKTIISARILNYSYEGEIEERERYGAHVGVHVPRPN